MIQILTCQFRFIRIYSSSPKIFWVDIKGWKEEATMLFMKIDSMSRINNDKGKEIA